MKLNAAELFKMSFRIYLILAISLRHAICDGGNHLPSNVLATQLHYVRTLDANCALNVCRNFHFDKVDEIAFFDLKEEIRISPDATTYDIKSTELLRFENSSFAHFPLHLFYAMGVQELDMRNCSVETVTWENFLMAVDLKVLLLSQNHIKSIETSTFSYALNLQFLFLDDNRLQHLVNESFKGLEQLFFLNLQHNRLKELPLGIFRYLPALQELNLANNHLRYLHNDLFVGNERLRTLQLANNRLTQIDDNVFKAPPQLLLLDLSHNAHLQKLVLSLNVRNLIAANCSLNRVDIYGSAVNVDMRDNQILELYFSQPETLENLNLRNNRLQQIASLTRVINLRALTLADNPQLGDLPNPWQVNSLERLDISNTSSRKLPIELLAQHSNLRILNISHNQFEQIDPLNFQNLEKLSNFYIHANKWNCYNLRLLMDMLLLVNGITFTPDAYDANFPGEYIGGIACMYRLDEAVADAMENNDADVLTLTPSEIVQQYDVAAEQLNADPNAVEVQNLRKEFKAIVGFYEEKFKKAFDEIEDLRGRLLKFERFNETMWKHITITV